jgi:hypothetical protein
LLQTLSEMPTEETRDTRYKYALFRHNLPPKIPTVRIAGGRRGAHAAFGFSSRRSVRAR